nr:uncharacterized protein LOC100180335 isoform X2 [Ciona intestinalis]|eukprot:XP_026695090.1 uncharacterized protein LOC100180335 isoform X2 [Ciona intestinalis]
MALANMFCRVCEKEEPNHICFTCVNPLEKDNTFAGVLLCEQCRVGFHSQGFFLGHDIQPLKDDFKKKMYYERVKVFRMEAQEKIKLEISRKKNLKTKIMEQTKQAHAEVHSNLLEIYNSFLKQLNCKETELVSEIDQFTKETNSKLDAELEKWKELENKVTTTFAMMLASLSDDKSEFNEQDICTVLENNAALLNTALIEIMDKVVGPYANISPCLADENTQLFDISAISLKSIDFYTAETIWANPAIMTDVSFELNDGFEFDIPKQFLGKHIMNHRTLSLYLPHPCIVNHGKFILGILENYIMNKVNEGMLALISEKEMPLFNEKLVVARCKTLSKFFRCSFSLPGLEDTNQHRNRGEMIIHHPDEENEVLKRISPKKLEFFKPDEKLLQIQPLCVQVNFTKSLNTSAIPYEVKLKLKRLLEKGESMKVKLMEKNKKDGLDIWEAQVTVDDTEFNELVVKAEKQKTNQLCKDVRLQNQNLPVVREIVETTDEVKEKSTDASQSDKDCKLEIKLDEQKAENKENVSNDQEKVLVDKDNRDSEFIAVITSVESALLKENLEIATSNEKACGEKIATSEPIGSLKTGKDCQQTVGLSALAQDYIQRTTSSSPPRILPAPENQSWDVHHLSSSLGNPQMNFQPPAASLAPEYPLLQFAGSGDHNIIQQSGWDISSKRSLKYFTLILFGENSNEFINIDNMGEPPPPVKLAWQQAIQTQQQLWEGLPFELFQHILECEVERFPELHQEFYRFRVPMDISSLPERMGLNFNSYLKKFPEIQMFPNASVQANPTVVLERNNNNVKVPNNNQRQNIPGLNAEATNPALPLDVSSSNDSQISNSEQTNTSVASSETASYSNVSDAWQEENDKPKVDNDRHSNRSRNSSFDRLSCDGTAHGDRGNRRYTSRQSTSSTMCYNCNDRGHATTACPHPVSRKGNGSRNRRHDDSSRRGKRQWRDPKRK